jgi:voltage-dependent calcium channel L type alpha-1D
MIFYNTILLATDQYPYPEVDQITTSNQFFTIFFTLEFLLKILAYEFKIFISDKMNIFDLLIVVSSIIELIISTK